MNCDDLNSLISEDIISEEENCETDHSIFNLHPLDRKNSDPVAQIIIVDDVNCPDSPRVDFESDSNHDTESPQAFCKIVTKDKPNEIRKVTTSSKDAVSPTTVNDKNEDVPIPMWELESPTDVALLPTNSKMLIDNRRIDDYSLLENKINDSLLDMLQGKVVETLPKTVQTYQTEEKPDESVKFITIFPANCLEKTISLMVKGKTCRSKQPLNATEMRVVSRIVNQETMFGRKSASYKNVYYDPETDSNIRYEVHRRMLTEVNSSPSATMQLKKNAKAGPNSLIRMGKVWAASDDGKLARNKVARTRFGRISRPPRHVVRDYKRLKYLSELNNEADENENTGGYSDYDIDEEVDVSDDEGRRGSGKRDLYGPLEPSKRQFSSLSICPTCNKVYLGYRRMAIHFQKYPEHKDEELLRQLLENRKKGMNYDNWLREERIMNTGNNDCRKYDVMQKTSLNKKGKLNGKLIEERFRNPAVCIKELLSRFGTKEIAKYSGPIVAETLSSWEYLLLRGEKLKSADGTLLISLLKELKVILAQIQAVSSHKLEPLTKQNQSSPHKLTIGPSDVLQHVLGVAPGTYVISDSKLPLDAPSKQRPTSLSIANPATSRQVVRSADNTIAKLFDAAVAECLRDESAAVAVGSDQRMDTNGQDGTLLVLADGATIDPSEVPVFTTDKVATQLVIPETAQPSDANSSLVLDFDVFNESPSSNFQFSTAVPASRTGGESVISDVPPSVPVLNDMGDSGKQHLDTDILDFSLLE